MSQEGIERFLASNTDEEKMSKIYVEGADDKIILKMFLRTRVCVFSNKHNVCVCVWMGRSIAKFTEL